MTREEAVSIMDRLDKVTVGEFANIVASMIYGMASGPKQGAEITALIIAKLEYLYAGDEFATRH